MNTPHDNHTNDSIEPEVGIIPLPKISIQPNISVNVVELSSHDPMGVEKEQQLPNKPDPSNNKTGDKPQEDKSMDLTLPGIDDESFNKRKTLHETINPVMPSRPFSGVQSFANTTRVVYDTPDLKSQGFRNKQGEFKSLNIDDETEEEKQHNHGKPANNPASHLNVEVKPEEVISHNTSNNMAVVLPREENIGFEPAQGDAPLEDDFDAVPINLENIPQGEVKDIANTKATNYMVHEGIEKEKPAFDYLKEMKTRLRSWYRKDASGFSGFFCCFLYLIGMLVILSVLFSFTFKYKELNLLSVSQPLEYLAENLKSDPIYQFKLISPGDTCPSDYELMVLGNWPGTEDGCLCSRTDLKYGSCDASDGGSYCDEISSIKSIDLYIWSEYAWCVQRAKLGTDYMKSVVCPDNFAQCSPGLCMQNTLDCPLTSFTMTDSNVNSDSIAYGSRYLTPYRELDKPPLIGLKATVNNLPCFNPALAPTGAEPYLLIKDPPQDCGKYGLDDHFSFVIDTKTEEQTFQSNMFKQAVFDLPLYEPILQETDIVLSGTTKISVAAIDVCMSIDPTQFSEASHSISNVYKGIRGTTIAALTFHLIIFFQVIIFIALYAKSNRKFDKYILKHDKNDVWVMYLIAFGAESIIYMVMVGIIRKNYSTLKGFVTNFTLWRDAGCFPVGQPNALLTDYLSLLDEFISPLHSFSISLLVVSLVCFCYLGCLAIKRS